MKIKKSKHHILSDFRGDRRITDENFLAKTNEEKRKNLVFFTSVLPGPDGELFCGISHAANDILHRFDPESKQFSSLHYDRVAEPEEVKVHRSLQLSKDGTLWAASAGLVTPSRRLTAPGGGIIRVPRGAEQAEKVAVPVTMDYIQTITLDDERQLIHGQTYSCPRYFVYDIASGETQDFGFMGSSTHRSALDDDGGFWGTYFPKNRLFRYDPHRREIQWFDHGLPGVFDKKPGEVDVMLNAGDGWMYLGSSDGSLFRLDPKTADVEYLGHPCLSKRMPGLEVWKDSLLIGCTGDDGNGSLFAYDRDTGAFHLLGPVVDDETGLQLFRVHDLAVMRGGTLAYLGETDVPMRSGYLWECELEI